MCEILLLDHVSLGAFGDSFYEYLLKAWIQSGKKDEEARRMYDDAMTTIIKHMITRSPKGLLYAPDLRNMEREFKMGHLTCFAGNQLIGLLLSFENSEILLFLFFTKKLRLQNHHFSC